MKNDYPHLEPGAKQSIDYCKKEQCKLITSILGYQTDEESLMLMDMLRYAREIGVTVIFAENSEEGE